MEDSSSATSDTVTGLSSETTYYFEVTALNSAGESALSNESSATTDHPVHGLKSQLIQFGPLASHVTGVDVYGLGVSIVGADGFVPLRYPRRLLSGRSARHDRPARHLHDHGHQAGNADFAPAPDQPQSFQVEQVVGRLRPQAITFLRPADVTAAQPDKLSASASSGLAVSFLSDTPGVCSVAGSEATTVRPGTCMITASQAGNTQYAPAPDQTQSFRIGPGVPRASRVPVIVLAGIVLAAAAGAMLVRRYRLRVRRPPKLSIRAKPHADSRGTVRLRVTGTDVTRTVRIEPHPSPVSSRLERPNHERHWTRADT